MFSNLPTSLFNTWPSSVLCCIRGWGTSTTRALSTRTSPPVTFYWTTRTRTRWWSLTWGSTRSRIVSSSPGEWRGRKGGWRERAGTRWEFFVCLGSNVTHHTVVWISTHTQSQFQWEIYTYQQDTFLSAYTHTYRTECASICTHLTHGRYIHNYLHMKF